MKLAVLSDIHGNGVALEAVLADLSRRPADQVVCLGDAIQGGPQPVEVVQRLRELRCAVVMGNADAWLLTGEESGREVISEERRASMEDVRIWMLDLLSDEDKTFIGSFSPTIEVELDGELRFFGYHGSPRSFDDILLPHTPEEEFRAMVGERASTVMAGGHVHLQFIRHLGRTFHFNPGSVGVAYRHDQDESDFRLDPWAEYAVLTTEGERLSLEFRRVPVDVQEMASACRASGRPHAEDWIRPYL